MALDTDIEKAKKKRIMLCSPRGTLSVHEVDKIRSGVLHHLPGGDVMVPRHKREFADGREPWIILDSSNCSPAELQTIHGWIEQDRDLNGRAPPIPPEKRPYVVRKRLVENGQAPASILGAPDEPAKKAAK